MRRKHRRQAPSQPYSGSAYAIPGGEMIKNWIKLTGDMALLGMEAQQVIGMRLMRIAAGGRGARFERGRMVSEKIAAAQEAARNLDDGWLAGEGRAPLSHARSQEPDPPVSSQEVARYAGRMLRSWQCGIGTSIRHVAPSASKDSRTSPPSSCRMARS